ncbi:DNA polymerase III subunit [Microscilla marina]|uniref:Putative DNA polymerase III, delta subunit n=1 Tax=Microscilla marina ATCC 23134 TaxID=313606 RepID=A1ZNC9_MICM2|nr:DNA polymerase III subunit delta' [Microscilla marina]EAY28040.1 putative DNA polymerase III, delta subunit [Microscilla marina ATCC 23134]
MLFKDIIGQTEIKQQLIHAIQSNHVAHAQMFWGAEGGAALPLALAYAQYIHCENKQATDACGTCAACIKSQKLIHPDLSFVFPVATTKKISSKPVSKDFMEEWRQFLTKHPYVSLSDWLSFIDAESKQANISVDESRHIIQQLSLKPFESEYKILLLWLPEFMNISAANAILKILEEPSPKTLFLLVSQNPNQLLATIISRVQAVQTAPITDEEVANYLVAHQQLPPEKAQQVAYMADGSINAAIHLLDNTHHTQHELFVEWMRTCFKKDMEALVSLTDTFAKLSKDQQKNLFQYGLHICREALVWKQGDEQLVRLAGKEYQFVQNFSRVLQIHNSSLLYEQFNDAIFHLERNASPKIVFMDTSLHIIQIINPTRK